MDKRWVLAALVMLTLVVSGLIAAVIFNAPTVEVAVGRAGIITAAASGPIGVLMLMLQVGEVKRQVGDVDKKVNGHVQQHRGHTDKELQEVIDNRLRELGTGPSLVQTPPEQPPP